VSRNEFTNTLLHANPPIYPTFLWCTHPSSSSRPHYVRSIVVAIILDCRSHPCVYPLSPLIAYIAGCESTEIQYTQGSHALPARASLPTPDPGGAMCGLLPSLNASASIETKPLQDHATTSLVHNEQGE
jgi:hypothetical protein